MPLLSNVEWPLSGASLSPGLKDTIGQNQPFTNGGYGGGRAPNMRYKSGWQSLFVAARNLPMTTKLLPVSTLAGVIVSRWQGTEMALTEAHAASDIRWEDASIPFLQLADLDLQLANGEVFKLCSQLADGSGFHGLYLEALDALPPLFASDDPSSICRGRELSEFPAGVIEIAELVQDGPDATVEIRLMVAGTEVRLVAGEVHEQLDGSLRVVERDESILLQLNGMWPPKD